MMADRGMLLVLILCCAQLGNIQGQHWWNFEDVINKFKSPAFTPLPDERFTHQTNIAEFSAEPNDVEVNIPKSGLGRFIGYSTWVNYDYTWSEWPPLKGRQVNVFLGIPYAARPVGDQRFRLPRRSYLDTRYTWYAKRYKPACLQNKATFRVNGIPGFDSFSEDCLYLNIFYPNRTWEPPTQRYPVVVHIHGGSFVYGSSHSYPGHALASMGVVVVTFNYRLGIFGFLSTGDFASQGNYGLWDQVEAMAWVRDNIWWFRGDPTNITLMGESAGAASVGFHLVSPITQGRDLFHRAIIMSGSELAPWALSDPDLIRPQHYAKELGQKLGCPTHDHYALVYCLRYYGDINKIIEVDLNITALRGGPYQKWTPVVDGTSGFLPRHPKIERAMLRFAKIPLLIGVVHNEGSVITNNMLKYWTKNATSLVSDKPIDEDQFQLFIRYFLKDYNVNEYVNETAEEIYMRYTWWSNPNNQTARREEMVAIFSDFNINSPVDATLRSQAPYNPNTYFYEFAYRGLNDTTSKHLGIYHGVELGFIFGYPFMNHSWMSEQLRPNPTPFMVNQTWNYPYDTNMSEFSMMLWTNFIKIGNPTPWEIQNVTWLPYTVKEQNYIHIFTNSSIRQRYRQSHMAFWRDRFVKISDPDPPSEIYYWYPVFDVQIITYVLAVLLFFVLIGIIVLIVALCRRPDPGEFRETAGIGGDQFASVFKDKFSGYGVVETTDV